MLYLLYNFIGTVIVDEEIDQPHQKAQLECGSLGIVGFQILM